MHASNEVLNTLLILSQPFWTTICVLPFTLISTCQDIVSCSDSGHIVDISQKLPGLLCIKRKQETILCRNLVPEEMADCIVPLHCLTGCDANSGFYGKGKLSVYDKEAKSAEAPEQLSKCGNSLDIEEEAIEKLFEFTRLVIYGDKMSRTMGTARAAKWKAMKKKSFIRLPPDVDSLRQHCLRANYLAYLLHHPSLKDHPSPLGHGWELASGRCHPVRHTRPALPTHLPEPELSEDSEEDESDEDNDDEEDNCVPRQCDDSSECSDTDSIDSTSDAEC